VLILGLSYLYNSLITWNVRRSGPGTFLIDWVNITFFISFRGISSCIYRISGSEMLSYCFIVGKTVVRNKVSFSFKDTVISSFEPLTVGMMVWALKKVYFKAIQHLFCSVKTGFFPGFSSSGPCRNDFQYSLFVFRIVM
jgi:hypothetical protein